MDTVICSSVFTTRVPRVRGNKSPSRKIRIRRVSNSHNSNNVNLFNRQVARVRHNNKYSNKHYKIALRGADFSTLGNLGVTEIIGKG